MGGLRSWGKAESSADWLEEGEVVGEIPHCHMYHSPLLLPVSGWVGYRGNLEQKGKLNIRVRKKNTAHKYSVTSLIQTRTTFKSPGIVTSIQIK